MLGPCPRPPGVLPEAHQKRPVGFLLAPQAVGTEQGGRLAQHPHAAAVPLQALALLLLSVPRALSSRAQLDVPLGLPVSSLLFCLLLLALLATHVTVCTSAESARCFCSLPWPAAGAVMALISGLLCAVVSALAELSADAERLRKVTRVPACPAIFLDGCPLGPPGLSLTGIVQTVPGTAPGAEGPRAALCVTPRPSACLESEVPVSHAGAGPPAEGPSHRSHVRRRRPCPAVSSPD